MVVQDAARPDQATVSGVQQRWQQGVMRTSSQQQLALQQAGGQRLGQWFPWWSSWGVLVATGLLMPEDLGWILKVEGMHARRLKADVA